MLKFLSDLIDEKLEECDFVLEKAERVLKDKTDETIHVKYQNGKYRFYVYNTKTKEEQYIKQEEKTKIQKLVEIEFYDKMKKIAVSSRFHFKCMKKLVKGKLFEQALRKMHPAKREYVLKAHDFWKITCDVWEKSNYPHLQNLKSGELTKKGERVRSKIEKMVADLLFDLGIPYHYEETIIANGKTYSVDFVLFDVVTGKEVLLECFGMMENEKYAAKAIEKMNNYIAEGYVLGDTFMYIYTSGPFSISLETLKSWLIFRFAIAKYKSPQLA